MNWKLHAPIVIVAAGAMVAAFAGAFGLHRAGDDWLAVAIAMDAIDTGRAYAQITQPFTHHWSPLWYAFEIFNYRVAGWQTDTLIRLFVMAWVLVGIAVFVWLARRLDLSTTAIVFGIAVLVVHPIAAAAYYSFDCYSQVAADTLVWALTALLISAGLGHGGRGTVAGAVLLFVPALLFKEQALAAALNAVIVAAWFRNRMLTTAALVMIAMSAVFAWMRFRAGLWFEADGPFSLCPACVPANVAMLLGGSVLPLPAISVYVPFRAGQWTDPWLIGGVVAAAGVAVLLAMGIATWRRDGRAHAGLTIALLAAATFPVALLADIGELYAHALLFWMALLAAMAWHAASRSALLAGGLVVVLIASLFCNLDEMRETGDRSARVLGATRAALASVPSGAGLVVGGFDEAPPSTDYGLIRITPPGRLLLYGVAIDVAIRRDLVRFETDEEAMAWHDRTGRPIFVATADGARVWLSRLRSQ